MLRARAAGGDARARRRTRSLVLSAVVLLGALLCVATAPAAPITYLYDGLGRLIAVVDVGGETAVYTNDPVGNLLAISRQATTSVAVLDFSPSSGPGGTTVTVQGIGFSPSPAATR
jgi:YD repeat-containing protein